MHACRNLECITRAKRTAAKNRAELGGINEIRPRHTKKAAQGSRRWYRLQDEAFVRAFAESGETWPTEIGREGADLERYAEAARARSDIARVSPLARTIDRELAA
jgi:hypothetical protein